MENLDVTSAFWKNRKVLVTGHTGFKGSWLSIWLQKLGADVVGYSLPPPTNPNLFELASVSEHVTSIIGDVRDIEHVKSVIIQHQPEIVFHLAAQPLVRYSYVDPVNTYSTNVMGTVNILEAVRYSETVRVVVNITSDKCYENKEWIWGYRENDPLGGHDPYSSSKGCADLITSAFRNSYFITPDQSGHYVALASARSGNVIGGGDWGEDRLVPDIIKAFTQGRPVMIRYPDAVRPWQHVLEALNGYLILARRLREDGAKYAEAWNFGPYEEDAMPTSWIATRIASIWGEDVRWERDPAPHPHEANYLKLDWSKARVRLGWMPKLSLSKALEWTIEWYKAYNHHYQMREFTEMQISLFQDTRTVSCQADVDSAERL